MYIDVLSNGEIRTTNECCTSMRRCARASELEGTLGWPANYGQVPQHHPLPATHTLPKTPRHCALSVHPIIRHGPPVQTTSPSVVTTQLESPQGPQGDPGVHCSVVVVVLTSGAQVQELPAGVHTQLSLLPLVQLHAPDLHAAIATFLHEALDLPRSPAASTSSEHAGGPQAGGSALETIETITVRTDPRTSTPSPKTTFRACIG